MYHYLKSIVMLSFALLVGLDCFSQGSQSQTTTDQQLSKVIDQWFTSIGKADLKTFSNMLTDDFQLMAFGNRYNKEAIVELAKEYSEVKYALSNVKSGSGGDIAFMTFDVKLDCKISGKPYIGNAMETYLFRKISNEWKVQTKVIVMMEDKK